MLFQIAVLSIFHIITTAPNIITVNHASGQRFIQNTSEVGDPDRSSRLRVIVKRIIMSQSNPPSVFPVNHVQLRWTLPIQWSDEGGEKEERTYEVYCNIQDAITKEQRTLIDIEIPDEFTGYDERFRLPEKVFRLLCAVRPRNAFDLPSEWTNGTTVRIDNRNFTVPDDYFDDLTPVERRRSPQYEESTNDILNVEGLPVAEVTETEKKSNLTTSTEVMEQTTTDLLSLLKQSTLTKLTEEVDLEEYKLAGKLTTDIIVHRRSHIPKKRVEEEKEDDIKEKEDYQTIENELMEALHVTENITVIPSEYDYFLEPRIL